jgi:hypothetical protein
MKQSTLADIPVEADIATPSTCSAMASVASIALLLLTTASCGFPRPPDLTGDAPGGMDGPAGPIVAIHVSPSGDDSNDGLVQPVKTLKHAIQLAAAITQITQIVLAAGTYSASSGETFPYIIPANITVVGPASGGAIIAGDKTVPGVTVDAGGLQDLALQDFATAVTVTGTASLKNVRILTSMIAVRIEATGSLTVNNLDITGVAPTGTVGCSTGIILNGAAKLVATTLIARGLAPPLDARDQSVVVVADAMIMGNATCSGFLSIMSAASFSMSDSLLDGSGIGVYAQSTSFHATISNTIIRGGLGGFPNLKGSFQMIGGELASPQGSGAQLGLGTWSFTNVTIHQNEDLAFYLQGADLVMRNCQMTDNGEGIDVFQGSTADLGTVANPGGNVFQRNKGGSVFAESPAVVNAVGNTWAPNVQGADGSGRYAATATISGPVTAPDNGNFGIANGSSILR